jgi:hypothetical protein
MSSKPLTLWAVVGFLAGLMLLGYVVLAVPPATSNGAIDTPVFLLFLIACLLTASCFGILIALQVQRRSLPPSGKRQSARNRKRARPEVALRQGMIFGVTCTILIGLATTDLLDIVVALVVLLLAGFVEAFAQARSRRLEK